MIKRFSAVLTLGVALAVAPLSKAMPSYASPCAAASGVFATKWRAFGGPVSSIGCAEGAAQNVTTPLGPTQTRSVIGQMQLFDHGVMVSNPDLGPNMTLSAWYNGSSSVHVDFSNVSPYPAGYILTLKNSAGTISRVLPGGTPGHNRDIALGALSGQGVKVELQTCAAAPVQADCKGALFVGSALLPIMIVGSYSNNLSHATPIPKPPVVAPSPNCSFSGPGCVRPQPVTSGSFIKGL